jgi:hypothetical protein
MLTSAEYPKPWEKVADYAELVIGSIARTLGAVPVVNFDAPFHVVLAAPSISVRTPNGDASPATPETLEQSLGATLLFHPVRHLATSLEEWIRYPPPAVRNLLRRQGYVGDAVVRTDNTTVVFMPKSPDWLVVEYREMVEFVASLPPLLTLWEKQALTLDEELEKWLLRDPSVDTLHRHEIEILELEHDVRRQLAFLRSPALCRTRGQRQFLDDLWRAAGLPALERELERRLTQLTARQERIAAMIRRQEQEHNESLGRRVELVLALIAGLSVAGVLQWLNDVLNVEARIWALPQGILLAVVAALVFVVVWAWARKSERPS